LTNQYYVSLVFSVFYFLYRLLLFPIVDPPETLKTFLFESWIM